jgi:3-phenylpropionate/trans-cinnamate dioxygenase ferredoxin subunit
MDFVKIGKVGDVPENGMKGFVVNGNKIVVANVGGKLHAMCSSCTHRGGHLEKGKLNGNIVTCPLHGSKFDLTNGKVVGGPAKKDEISYEVKSKDGDLLVRM